MAGSSIPTKSRPGRPHVPKQRRPPAVGLAARRARPPPSAAGPSRAVQVAVKPCAHSAKSASAGMRERPARTRAVGRPRRVNALVGWCRAAARRRLTLLPSSSIADQPNRLPAKGNPRHTARSCHALFALNQNRHVHTARQAQAHDIPLTPDRRRALEKHHSDHASNLTDLGDACQVFVDIAKDLAE